jgi:lipid-A-disaccharide synthase-like uncharacterized protein
MRCHEDKHNTVLKFPRAAFWIVHIFGSLFLILFGLRLALKKAPLPIIAYRLIKMLR